ncbi:unnamed protein product [Acidithrix sp. C25]|nr:unnamed protein product [Acidithrix sp. C25]
MPLGLNPALNYINFQCQEILDTLDKQEFSSLPSGQESSSLI